MCRLHKYTFLEVDVEPDKERRNTKTSHVSVNPSGLIDSTQAHINVDQ